MKKKFFTLLTLLLVAVTGAWAGDYVDTYGSLGTVTGDYIANGISKITLGNYAKANSGIQATETGKTFYFTVSVPSGFTIKTVKFKGSNTGTPTCKDTNGTISTSSNVTTYTASNSITSVEFTIPSSSSSKTPKVSEFVITTTSDNTDDYELITPQSISSGVITYTSSLGDNKLVSAMAGIGGPSVAAGDLNFGNGKGFSITTSRAIKAVYCVWFQRQPSNNAGWVGYSEAECTNVIGTYTNSTNAWVAPDTNTKYVAFKRTEGSTAKLSSIHIFYYDDLPVGPTISASPTSITLAATESDVAVNSSFTITGSNLTAGTYDLTVPSVTGLTVSPTSFTVASDGTVSQVVNVSYSSTENVTANSANITATVGEVSLSVPVNYSASVNSWTLQTISSAKSWDFSKLSGGVQYSGDNLTTEHVYANISEITFPADFDATSLAFTGEYPLRSGKGIAQNGTLKFNTSVPGTIVVKFSDTGTSASSSAVKRYLVVNGNTTEYWASRQNNGTDNPYDARLNVTTDAIAVPAGDVTISGTSALVYSLLTFAPATSTTVTLASSGTSSFSSSMALDFSAVEGLKAYAVTNVTSTTVTMTSVDAAPASTGLVLKGTGGATYSIPVATTTPAAVSGNKLVATVERTNVGANNAWVINGGEFKLYTDDYVPAGKAYLPATEVPAAGSDARLTMVFGDESTGISSMHNSQFTMHNEIYDLQGRRVSSQCTVNNSQLKKGLYIVNGKKVIK